MPDPLSSNAVPAAGFTSYIEQYSGTIYALSCLLLEKGARADQAAIATFAALYEPWLKGSIQADAYSLAAYRECIRQCSLVAQDRGRCSSALLTWEDQIASALWYGIQLPLPEISLILQRSVPELKAQLRGIREQMAAARPAVPRPSAG
ncbi:hypothetical protein P40081_03180 [Paenibacillus sp. FSL P4-0081]|jgi:hypothetical protein|uniref:hypothetical protein n=1 Tax=Paenibacillus sp. FSL P4-0081 TaxID=1536769 RepID=UPI0004F59178|nr:hypothetical protein [Paenibacillus sp. FSL P4-0081]AIQ27310.1 hypothetical protein P40081_03180 [Paenibacillus sp. FSL P4-0081]